MQGGKQSQKKFAYVSVIEFIARKTTLTTRQHLMISSKESVKHQIEKQINAQTHTIQ